MRHARWVGAARHYTQRAYETARHMAGGLDHVIQNSARMYGGLIQPILHSQGVDTSGVDRNLLDAYSHYSRLKGHAQNFDALVKGE